MCEQRLCVPKNSNEARYPPWIIRLFQTEKQFVRDLSRTTSQPRPSLFWRAPLGLAWVATMA